MFLRAGARVQMSRESQVWMSARGPRLTRALSTSQPTGRGYQTQGREVMAE